MKFSKTMRKLEGGLKVKMCYKHSVILVKNVASMTWVSSTMTILGGIGGMETIQLRSVWIDSVQVLNGLLCSPMHKWCT